MCVTLQFQYYTFVNDCAYVNETQTPETTSYTLHVQCEKLHHSQPLIRGSEWTDYAWNNSVQSRQSQTPRCLSNRGHQKQGCLRAHSYIHTMKFLTDYCIILMQCCSIVCAPLYVWFGLTQRVTSGPHDLSTSTACAWFNPSRLLPLTERISSPRESTPSVGRRNRWSTCVCM